MCSNTYGHERMLCHTKQVLLLLEDDHGKRAVISITHKNFCCKRNSYYPCHEETLDYALVSTSQSATSY